MEMVKKQNILISWLAWHFYDMPRFLFSVWKNYLGFALDFFSAPLLLSTLFSPWRKYKWNYPRGFDFVEYLNTFFSNLFSRLIGAICRLVLIVFGVIAQVGIFFAGLLVMVVWLVLPFIFIGLIIFLFRY